MTMVVLDQDEQIISRVRRHWFVMVRSTLGTVFLAVLPLVLWTFVEDVSFLKTLTLHTKEITLFLYVIFLIFLWMFYFLEWTDYYLDVWIITNKRVIDVEQKGLFRREIISLRYDRIQDVTVITNGIIQTMFDFGKIHLQTAGEHRKIILKDAPQPELVKQMILGHSHNASLPDDFV